MIITPEAFLDAPLIRTRQTRLVGEFEMGVSLNYTTDERGLLVHDCFDRTLHRVDLTLTDLPSAVIGNTVIGFAPSSTPRDPSGYVLTQDWHVVRKASWGALPRDELVCKITPEPDEPPVLLKTFGDVLAVCSITTSSFRVTVVDTHRGTVASQLVQDRGSDALSPWVNVRIVNGRLYAEWLDWSRVDWPHVQTYCLYDCMTQTEVYTEQFRGEDTWLWSWPSHPYESYPQVRGGVICCRERGEVLLLRNSHSRPVERMRVGTFDDELSTSRCEDRDIVCVFGGRELRVYADSTLHKSIPVADPDGRFIVLNDGVRAVALYEWVQPSQNKVRLTGIFDYQRGLIVNRADGHVNGSLKRVSSGSVYLTSVYAKHNCGNLGEASRYPHGTVVVSDL